MLDRLKSVAGSLIGIAVFLAVLSLPFIFIKGSLWASAHLLRPLISIGWIAVAVLMAVLLPLSIFRPLRPFTGSGIFLSSFLFGLIAWLLGFVLTYSIWGVWAVIIGLFFLGFGVVPIALLATLIKGMWSPFFTLLVLMIVVMVTRVAGLQIAAAAEE